MRHSRFEDTQATFACTLFVSLYMREKHGWRAGKAQMCIDCSIVARAFFIGAPGRIRTRCWRR